VASASLPALYHARFRACPVPCEVQGRQALFVTRFDLTYKRRWINIAIDIAIPGKEEV
jgi:hypothetical protein